MALGKSRSAEDASAATSFFYNRMAGVDIGHFAGMWHLLGVAHLLTIELGRAAKEHGLSGADLLLLGTLRVADGSPMRATELSEKLHVSAAVFSTRVVKLEHAGLIIRERCPSDRRASLITLTGDGERAADEAIADLARRGAFAQAHRRLSTEQQSLLVEILTQLHDYLDRHVQSSPRL